MLNRLFFGLGILLGVVLPEPAPLVAARLYRSEEAIFLNAELEGAFQGTALELAAEGTRVAFRLEARIEGAEPPLPALVIQRSLRFDGARGLWVAGMEEAGDKEVGDRDAAALLASRIWRLRLCPLAALPRGGSLRLKASSGILDEAGAWHEAGILWGYVEPSRVFAFADPMELPH